MTQRPVAKVAAVDRKIQKDWVFAENSIFDRVDRYTTEHLCAFPGGRIEVRHFSWSQPMSSIWETGKRCYLFNMSLSNHEPATTLIHLASGIKKHRTARGGLTFVPPGQRMCSTFAAGGSRSLCFMLDSSIVEAYLSDAPQWHRHVLRDCWPGVAGTEIEWLLRRMYREVQEPDFATVDVLQSLARQMAVEIVRKFRLRDTGTAGRTGGLAPWRMRVIRERVHSDAPLPDLETAATLCDLTVRQLTRAFRAHTGQTLGRYIESAMVERARALLQAQVPVWQVAKSLGYSHSGAFASAFRRATGMRPSEVAVACSPQP